MIVEPSYVGGVSDVAAIAALLFGNLVVACGVMVAPGMLDDLARDLQVSIPTAGQLLHDKQLYENMNRTIADMRGLIAEIKKDPKKYLNVKVSIF